MDNLFFTTALAYIDGVGASIGARLIRHFKSAEAVFEAPKNEILPVVQGNLAIANEIKSKASFALAEKSIKESLAFGAEILVFNEPNYPLKLKNIPDAPLILYCKGNTKLFFEKSVAMVGTRRATSYGRETVNLITEALQPLNPVVVSGMAEGIDIAAHTAAMEKKLNTFAVLAHGLNKAYPAAHKKHMQQIAEGAGCLISEHPLNTYADTANFPRRNRIIAGLSDALIIVESNVKGGAMLTARLANDYNRDVFAVPGKITDVWSKGTNFLISNNEAHLFLNAEEFALKMGWSLKQRKPESVQPSLFLELSESEKQLLEVIRAEPLCSIDQIFEKTQWSMSKINATLLNLELNNVIKILPGKQVKAL
ncbi:MAG: DNA-processing protein DprA [Luteibaculaceae bacterium]